MWKQSEKRATLQFRRSSRFTKARHGPRPVLGEDEEETIVKWAKECHRKGFPKWGEDIQASIKQYLDSSLRQNPFKDNIPGPGWFKAFLRRHPELTTRTPEGVTAASSTVAEMDIRKWFKQIEQYFQEKKLTDVLKDPSRIFNGDETNFQLCPKTKKKF